MKPETWNLRPETWNLPPVVHCSPTAPARVPLITRAPYPCPCTTYTLDPDGLPPSQPKLWALLPGLTPDPCCLQGISEDDVKTVGWPDILTTARCKPGALLTVIIMEYCNKVSHGHVTYYAWRTPPGYSQSSSWSTATRWAAPHLTLDCCCCCCRPQASLPMTHAACYCPQPSLADVSAMAVHSHAMAHPSPTSCCYCYCCYRCCYCRQGSLTDIISKGIFMNRSTRDMERICIRAIIRTAREVAQGMSHLHSCQVRDMERICIRAIIRTAREVAQGMSHLHSCQVNN